jgi:hypothetical protein
MMGLSGATKHSLASKSYLCFYFLIFAPEKSKTLLTFQHELVSSHSFQVRNLILCLFENFSFYNG